MTLVELLIAMSVVAILLLGGVGVYFRMNRGFALQAATSSIESVLRSARAFAIHERGPAVVVAEPLPDNPALVALVYALGRQTVSCWHFEAEQFAGTGGVLGALDQVATEAGGTAGHAPGRIGRALSLDGSLHLRVASPYLDGLREGVFIECYVCPQAAPSGTSMPIVSKQAQDGSSYWWLSVCAAADNSFGPTGGVFIEGAPVPHTLPLAVLPLMPAGQWSHLAMAYYRDSQTPSGDARGVFEVRVNGEEVHRSTSDSSTFSMRLAANTAPMQIGSDGTNRFKGRIDELKIAGLVAGEVHNLPKNTEVRLDAGGSRDGRVHFDAEGKLDATHHTRPVLFRILGDPISHEERLLRVVRVTWLGCVEVFQGEPPAE